MSKLVKKLLQNSLIETQDKQIKPKKSNARRKIEMKNTLSIKPMTKKQIIESNLQSMLMLDRECSSRADSVEEALKSKNLKDFTRRDKKRIRSMEISSGFGTLSNSRSSSSINSSKKHVPTYNKRKAAVKVKRREMTQLAGLLQGKKKKRTS